MIIIIMSMTSTIKRNVQVHIIIVIAGLIATDRYIYFASLQDNIQRILLSLAVRIQTTHRSFEKRRYLLAYHLFVKLVCRELESDLENTRSFIIMDIVATIVRILSSGCVGQLFPLCCDTLEIVCRAGLESCPEELTRHLHSLVALLTGFAQSGFRDKVNHIMYVCELS